MLRVNLIKPKKLEALAFTRADLVRIGAKAIESVTKRVALGLNEQDRTMKPLSASYRAKKVKMGQPGIRNMMLSGSMLGALTVVEADNNHVTVGFTRQAELAKASKNQDRSDWFGLSKSDEAKVMFFAGRILANKTSK